MIPEERSGPPIWKVILGTAVALGASAALVTYLDSISVKTSDHDTDGGPVVDADGWTTDLPDQFKGTWVADGLCDSDSAPLVLFSNGGYRWRDGPTNWGFARGHFRYDSPATHRVFFRLSKLNSPHDGTADYVITVSGIELNKYNLKAGTSQSYEKCE
ncbi:hypothetical protein [uncultured Rhodospira sp.]|uniref:hypothetical protein n=1 Tax=uncultured Rhodospira sp. TaxID=1936189 RepID=UPI0026360870|nr:hypothetical protein [uncultured Rhodospira sp.]